MDQLTWLQRRTRRIMTAPMRRLLLKEFLC
jgi:hypothetical protein